MSKLLIKIVSESFDGNPLRQMGGLSGLNYDFHWNRTIGQFIYVPKSQEEIDDILAVNWACKNFPWRFSVCLADGIDLSTPSEPQPKKQSFITSIPPFVKSEHYANYPAEDLVDLARNSGFTPEGDLTDTGNLLRQLHAYFVGRAFSIEQESQLRSEVEQLKRDAAITRSPVPTEPLPAVASTVTSAVINVTTKPVDRAAKAREAKARKRNERLQGNVVFRAVSVPRAQEMVGA